LVGSRLLAEIGNSLKARCRLIDFAFRYGGDEFVILLPQTSKENALNVARRLHKLIRSTPWLDAEGLKIRVTPSLGVASYPVDARTKEGLLHLADEAMYLVKNTNRDSVGAANIGILEDTVNVQEGPLDEEIALTDRREGPGDLPAGIVERRRDAV